MQCGKRITDLTLPSLHKEKIASGLLAVQSTCPQYVCIEVLQHKVEWMNFLTELRPRFTNNAACKKLWIYVKKQLAAI